MGLARTKGAAQLQRSDLRRGTAVASHQSAKPKRMVPTARSATSKPITSTN